MENYYPEPVPLVKNPQELAEFIHRELLRISTAIVLGKAQQIEFRNVAPDRVYEGLILGADGTNWDPGSGQGVYVYYNSTWNKL